MPMALSANARLMTSFSDGEQKADSTKYAERKRGWFGGCSVEGCQKYHAVRRCIPSTGGQYL